MKLKLNGLKDYLFESKKYWWFVQKVEQSNNNYNLKI